MVSAVNPRDAIDAQAAAWVARLQGDAPAGHLDGALKLWLDANPTHQAAFERATEIWALLPGAALCRDAEAKWASGSARPVRASPARWVWQPLALAASLVLVVGLSAWLWLAAPHQRYATATGEQKVATLADGSRIALNTDSQLDVAYDPRTRHIRLDRGEAMFEVAHNAERPFIVTAGTKQVRAVGTAFIVRRIGSDVIVTLVQGKVAVTDTARTATRATYLTPGERLTAPASGTARMDRQSPEAATAWRRGQAVFADTPLASAVADLNRYGGPGIVIDDPAVSRLPISGVFATNDTEEFVRAVALLHGLHVQQQGGAFHFVR
jgi:transmembrane sensor